MKNHLCRVSLFALLILLSLSVSGQRGVGGFHFSPGLPAGSFNGTAGTSLFPSVGVSGLLQVAETPIFAGGEFVYSCYGTALTKSTNVISGTEHEYRIRRNNNYLTAAAVVRLMVPESSVWVRPFVEGQFGGIYAYTRSGVRKYGASEPLSEGTEVRDFSHIWLLGGGIMIPVERSGEANLELRVNYLRSGRLEYLTRDDAVYDDQGDLTLNPRNAPFRLLQPAIALRMRF